jgi:nitroimidazol reductase NimA-like FMN-containing flavoprotein (pyridoxamine 5'-phosphate oxidase superfamily)
MTHDPPDEERGVTMDKTHAAQPDLVELSPYECWQLVEEPIPIARVVWTDGRTAAIVPVNYAVADGALWFQSTPGSRLGRECNGRQVLVEIDSVDEGTRSGWSVIVTGVAQNVDADDVPGYLGELQVWPRGPRTTFVRVHPDEITGRRLMPRP